MESERYRGYSDLEVDGNPQVLSEKGASQFVDAQGYGGGLPEVVPSKHTDFPEAINTTLPEAINHTLPEPVAVGGKRGTRTTICGFRRRTFFIVLAIIILVIIAAAVGGGVGGALANKSKSSNNEADTNPTTSTTPGQGANGTTSGGKGLLPTSNFASVNYTDEYGYENRLVYFQANSSVLYQSAWNSSDETWTVLPVTADSDDVKNNTPISASLYWHSESYRDLHVYFLTPENSIQGRISNDGGDSWTTSSFDDKYTASSSSQLASYGRECVDCLDTNLVIYQNSDNALQLCQNSQGGWSQTPFPSDVPTPVNGSRLALTPIYSTDSTKYLALYINDGNLQKLQWNGSDWTSEKLPTQPTKFASIAAYSSGWNSSDTLDLQVFSSISGGGVIYSFNNDTTADSWDINTSSGLDDVLDGSALAANQAGRVYGMVEGDSGLEIVEFNLTGSNTWARASTVNTTIS